MLVTGTHDPYLVALSILVATFASYTARDLAAHAGAARGLARRLWLVAGAVTMGGGIWSMHFVAMLAFVMPMSVTYEVGLTCLSLIIAIALTGLGFLAVSRSRTNLRGMAVGGLLMGTGICSMHYIGMTAMRIQGGIDYDPLLVTGS